MGFPIMVKNPRGPALKVMDTDTGPDQTRRQPASAARASARSVIVSIQSRSTPASPSVAACSANASVAASPESGPRGASNSPVGPMLPATTQPSTAAWRAEATALRLVSVKLSSRPLMRRRGRLPLKVLVMSTRAPAATYWR
jgi:hypothetical protein